MGSIINQVPSVMNLDENNISGEKIKEFRTSIKNKESCLGAIKAYKYCLS